MGIEDIPEMQLVINFIGKYDPDETDMKTIIKYWSLFIHIIHNPSSNKFLFGSKNFKSHEEIMEDFRRRLVRDYGIKIDEIDDFEPQGGGRVDLSGLRKYIHFSLECRYGKFDEEIVRPIAERYIEQYMDGPELKFL